MTMLSDEELAATVLTLWDNDSASARKIERHIDALTSQRDRARDIAMSLEQELAEAQAIPQRWVMGTSAHLCGVFLRDDTTCRLPVNHDDAHDDGRGTTWSVVES